MVIPCQVILLFLFNKGSEFKYMYNGVIYKISNSINEKLYIGKTVKNPIKYWKNHKSFCRNGYEKVLYSAMRKYGILTFKFEIIEKIKSNNINDLNNKLYKLEKMYIKILNTKVPNGYNVTDGGEGLAGIEFSEEHKQKISDALSGRTFSKEHCIKISKASKGRTSPNKNKKLSKSHKMKLSKSMAGKYDGNKNPFYGKKHNIKTRELISKKLSDGRLRGEKNPFYGKKHSKKTIEELKKIGKERQNNPKIRKKNMKNQPSRKPIKIIDKDSGKTIKVFLSLSQACRWIQNNTNYSGDRSYMTEIYKAKEKIAYGFKWKIVE